MTRTGGLWGWIVLRITSRHLFINLKPQLVKLNGVAVGVDLCMMDNRSILQHKEVLMMGECKQGNNEWSCFKCELELTKNVVSELEQKLLESESRVKRLSVKYRYEREERVPKLESIIEHAKYEVEIMNEVLKGENSCVARKFKTLKEVLDGEFI